MQFWIIFILCAILMVFRSCGSDSSNVPTLEKTHDEFINAYNAKVPDDLHLVMLDMNNYVHVDQFDKYPGSNRFIFGYSPENLTSITIGKERLKTLEVCYMYELEPDGRPSQDGLDKMEKIFIATIDALDDGWFTDEKGILNELGLYSKNGPTGEAVIKDGISYQLRVTNRGYMLYIEPAKSKK